jgi:hypothetical protein
MAYIIPVTYKNTEFWEKFKPENAEIYRKGIRNGEFHFETAHPIDDSDDLVVVAFDKESIERRLENARQEFHSHGFLTKFGKPQSVPKQWLVDHLGWGKHILRRAKTQVKSKSKRKIVKKKKGCGCK